MEREFERRRYVFRVDPLPVLSVDLQSRRRASRSAFFKKRQKAFAKKISLFIPFEWMPGADFSF